MVADALGRRVRDLVYAAHFGHIQPSEILGRRMTPVEYRLFLAELHELVQLEHEARPPPMFPMLPTSNG